MAVRVPIRRLITGALFLLSIPATLLLLLSSSSDRALSSSDNKFVSSSDPELGSARVVFQTKYGDIEFGFYPHVAPKTMEHIFKLVQLGCYNTNHFFRVDKGFVAQVADVVGGRTAPMNEEQQMEAKKIIVGEFSKVKHVRGILLMGRYADPDSAASSFSILLGDAPHLDGQYTIFVIRLEIDRQSCLSQRSWINGAKFFTGASAVGSIAIPAILRHAHLIETGAMLIGFTSFFDDTTGI